MRKIIIIVIILAIVLGVVFYFVMASRNRKPAPSNENVTLTMFGLWEKADLMKPAIEEYEKNHPNVKINYIYQTKINYRSRIQTQLDANQGPDIFMIHNSWLPIFLRNNSLAPLPKEIMSDSDYSKMFYPIVKDSFSKNGQNYALPQGVDGLALYVNEDLLAAAGVSAPTNWQEFTDAAIKLTKKDDKGNITVAGAALGTTGSIDHWSDILGLMFEQQGVDLEHPNSAGGAEILQFYTNFVKDPNRKVWDLLMGRSTAAFYSGKLAMYFGPSWEVPTIREANPQLKFRTVPVPQLSRNVVGWGTFWAFAVSNTSVNKPAAWEFLKYLSSAEAEKLLYKTASETRAFGQPYSRVDLQSEIALDPLVGAFVVQAPSYKSWYLCSSTMDQDINDKMIKYYEDAVNAVVQGSDPQVALETTAKGVTQVLADLNKASNASPAAK